MNDDDFEKLYCEFGIHEHLESKGAIYLDRETLKKIISEAVARERERCAKLVEGNYGFCKSKNREYFDDLSDLIIPGFSKRK